MRRVLIVEDEVALASAIAILVQRLGHATSTAASATLGLQRVREQRPDLVVLDIGLPDRNGLDALAELQATDPALPVLVITAHGNLQNAVEARKRGAVAYLVKPLDLQEFERTVRGFLATTEPVEPPSPDPAGAPLLIGSSAAMQPAFAAIAHACAVDAPVLITGPNGIGKSLAARVIHLHGARHTGPFVTLSCGGPAEASFATEVARLAGRAAGGTLFLDGVGELSLPAQLQLLQFVEERTQARGDERSGDHVDVRVIAAADQDLDVAVRERRFREDLYYRLRVLEVELPPLAERRSDIAGLSAFLLSGIVRGRGLTLSREALEVLRNHDWPGNVRELRNVLERAAAVCGGSVVLPTHLPAELQAASPVELPAAGAFPALDAALHGWLEERLRGDADYAALTDELESRLLTLLLPRFGNKPTHLARALGINRATLRKRLRERDDNLREPE